MARPSFFIKSTEGEARESLALGFLALIRGQETFLELELSTPDVIRLLSDLRRFLNTET